MTIDFKLQNGDKPEFKSKPTLKCKIWKDGHVLFQNNFSEVFLHPEQVKYLVNRINLHYEEFKNKELVKASESCNLFEDGVEISSVHGVTMIRRWVDKP